MDADAASLCAGLPHGPFILKDQVRWQALSVNKEPLSRRHRTLPRLVLRPGPGGWLTLHQLPAGAYLAVDGQQVPRYVLRKQEEAWDTLLLRRFACWQRGEELAPEVARELSARLDALARSMRR